MFRSIVLMGSGLALGCGGKAGVEGPSAGSPGNAGNAGDPGSAGASAGTGGAASAGSPSFAGGGAGGAFAGMPGIAGAPGCPPAQWTCAVTPCDGNVSWTANQCQCDPKRPASSSECDVSESFVCEGSLSSAADGLQGVECACVPAASPCSNVCRTALGYYADYYDCDDHSLPGTVLCGCAIVLLK